MIRKKTLATMSLAIDKLPISEKSQEYMLKNLYECTTAMIDV